MMMMMHSWRMVAAVCVAASIALGVAMAQKDREHGSSPVTTSKTSSNLLGVPGLNEAWAGEFTFVSSDTVQRWFTQSGGPAKSVGPGDGYVAGDERAWVHASAYSVA